jgi:hypothetical protein
MWCYCSVVIFLCFALALSCMAGWLRCCGPNLLLRHILLLFSSLLSLLFFFLLRLMSTSTIETMDCLGGLRSSVFRRVNITITKLSYMTMECPGFKNQKEHTYPHRHRLTMRIKDSSDVLVGSNGTFAVVNC